MKIVIWATCEDGEYGPQPTAYYTSRELAKQSLVRQWRGSEEAEETDYEESWEERKVRAQMGIPSREVSRFDVNRVGFRPRWRNEPDGDLQLAVWKNTGHYGPAWHVTGWLVERITVQDALEDEEAVAS